MNKKGIKLHLTKVVNDWKESIDDEKVKKAIERGVLITGGALVSLLNGEKPNDYDIYFKTREDLEIVARYYADLWNKNHPNKSHVAIIYNEKFDKIECFIKSKGIVQEDDEEVIDDLTEPSEGFVEETEEEQKVEKPKYRPRYFSSNAMTLSDKIQIVTRFYGSLEKIHENYDFIHCTCGFDYATKEVSIPYDALLAIHNKELIYSGSKYPICSIIRTRKYINRGYTINAGQYVKMCLQVNELDLKDIDVLKDQLTGVDSAYFNQVLSYLEQKKLHDENFSFDNTYLIEVINKIFG